LRALPETAVTARVTRIQTGGIAGTWIDIAVPPGFGPPKAGQFVQIGCQPDGLFRLKRPFSICRWRESDDGGEIGILFAVVGDGSRWLDARHHGDPVEVLGPLGNPFHPVPGRIPVLIGGGRGVAPLLLLADQMAGEFPDGLLLYGAKDGASLFPTGGCPYPAYRATLDGSAGQRGTVLDLLKGMLRQGAIRRETGVFYACGPMPMLEALSAVAKEAGIPAQVSLETTFGCGTGLCAGCAVPLHPRDGEDQDAFQRYAFACADGPVFDAARIDWPGVEE
jgi:dihydroorotate dehydrogenase electron transfer subunit